MAFGAALDHVQQRKSTQPPIICPNGSRLFSQRLPVPVRRTPLPLDNRGLISVRPLRCEHVVFAAGEFPRLFDDSLHLRKGCLIVRPALQAIYELFGNATVSCSVSKLEGAIDSTPASIVEVPAIAPFPIVAKPVSVAFLFGVTNLPARYPAEWSASDIGDTYADSGHM